jgi:hypothetical protein
MNKIIKTASIVTSGIIVGALVRKIVQPVLNAAKLSPVDSIKGVKNLFRKSNIPEDINNYFV